MEVPNFFDNEILTRAGQEFYSEAQIAGQIEVFSKSYSDLSYAEGNNAYQSQIVNIWHQDSDGNQVFASKTIGEEVSKGDVKNSVVITEQQNITVAGNGAILFTNIVDRSLTDSKNKTETSSVTIDISESAANSGSYSGTVTRVDNKGKIEEFDVEMDGADGLHVSKGNDVQMIDLNLSDLSGLFKGKEIEINLTDGRKFKGKYSGKRLNGKIWDRWGRVVAEKVRVHAGNVRMDWDW